MEKSWFKSKTVWGAIVLALLGGFQIYETGDIDIESLKALAAALGIFGLRHAME